MRPLTDGRWQTFVSSRGMERSSAIHASEADAVAAVADQVLCDPPARVRTPQERATGRERMRQATERALKRIDDRSSGRQGE